MCIFISLDICYLFKKKKKSRDDKLGKKKVSISIFLFFILKKDIYYDINV